MRGLMHLIATLLTGIGVKLPDLVCPFFMSPCQGLLVVPPFPLGPSLASRLTEALKERALHRAFFLKLSSGLDEATIKEWEELVKAWEHDQTKPSPFEDVKNSAYVLCLG